MLLWILICLKFLTVSVLCLTAEEIEAQKSGWSFDPNTQYHIQTDEGPERYFRFQTSNGQYRKEKRLIDGTVIGTEGWLDPLGYLRLKDYIADSNGFRILRSKMVYVGKDRPIYNAIAETKRVPAQSGVLVEPTRPPNPFRHSEANDIVPLLGNDISSDYYGSTTIRPLVDGSSVSRANKNYYYNVNGATFPSGSRNLKNYSQHRNTYYNELQTPTEAPVAPYEYLKTNLRSPISRSSYVDPPSYDGTHTSANGFQYYLKRQYHEEERDPTGANVGSFGYIDPFGIRRVIYYKTDSQTGDFQHKKNNRYVGFSATPYDPSPDRIYKN